MESVYVKTTDLVLLSAIENNSVDLVLTDPPYIISRKSGMQSYKNSLEKGGKEDEKFGKKYAITTEFGEWDSSFTIDDLEKTINEFYRILRPGGSCIIFFDIWKIETLSKLLSKFSKHRFIEWVKSNPMPVNQYATYLSNAREIAISCVKGGKATFNSKYDNGLYMFPLQGGKKRIHPTQKSLQLFEELIKKHSKENDIVVDTFLGAGTTALACKNTNRRFLGCEICSDYFDKIAEFLD